MRTVTIILVLLLYSCGHNLTERHYQSNDNETGGFNNFSLDLYPDGKLVLTITTSIMAQQTGSGIIWERLTTKENGKWTIKNNRINYVLNKPKLSIDSIFIETEFSELISRSIIDFSQKKDTAFIYGIPCPSTNK